MNKRLYHGIREAILDGSIAADSRLPASRDLAAELGIARNTVVHVYGQLLAEGYTRSLQGNGTFVNASQPDSYLASGRQSRRAPVPQPRPALSARGAAIVDGVSASPYQWGAFMPGVPDLTEFPHKKFGRIFSALWRNPTPDLLTYAYGGGLPALREALAQHLALTRSIDCDPDQILITEGSHQAIDLATRILGEAGETAWVEDPGYWGARTVLQANGLHTVHLPVDEEGMRLPDADLAPGMAPPRFIFVTPSHQYPLGPVMSLARRRQLLAVARRHGSWIIEDDYDSEFRHQGEPIAAMQGLLPDAPVLYVGTFSKTMFPALRLGFLVLPQAIAGPAMPSIVEMLRGGHRLEQLTMAAFIENGQFSRHLGRMRRLYRERQAALREALAQHLGIDHEVLGGHSGLHLTVRLPPDVPDRAVVEQARRLGMNPNALSTFAITPQPQDNGLVIGYGNTSADRYPALVRQLGKLAAALRH